MSVHLCRQLWIGYSPSCDSKWRPEGCRPEKLYPVVAYENGSLKRSDGSTGEAFYYHCIGEHSRVFRLIASNAVVAISDVTTGSLIGSEAAFWSALKSEGAPKVDRDAPF